MRLTRGNLIDGLWPVMAESKAILNSSSSVSESLESDRSKESHEKTV